MKNWVQYSGNMPHMKLPNAEKAVVEREKLADYLLNAAHPDNGGKAAFFEGSDFIELSRRQSARGSR